MTCMCELGWNCPTRLGNEDGGVSAVGAGAAVELSAWATHRQTSPGHGPDQLFVSFLLIRAPNLEPTWSWSSKWTPFSTISLSSNLFFNFTFS